MSPAQPEQESIERICTDWSTHRTVRSRTLGSKYELDAPLPSTTISQNFPTVTGLWSGLNREVI